jgi:hypothetical protein
MPSHSSAWGRCDKRPSHPSGGRIAEKKIIAVTGATGAQAGGLARAVLDDPSGEFALRAVTRNPAKSAARALADRGAEVVQADLDDEASLQRAFDGAFPSRYEGRGWIRYPAKPRANEQSRGSQSTRGN